MKTSSFYLLLSLAVLSPITKGVAQQPASSSAQPPPSSSTQPPPSSSTQPPPSSPVSTVAEDQQPSRADVVRMMDAMHIRSQLESMTKTMGLQMKQQVHAVLQGQPNMTPEQIKKFETEYDGGIGLYPISEMMDDMIPVYQRHMNKADIDAIVTFYSSPAGQHLLAEGPAIMKDSMGVLMPKVQTRMQAYMQKMKKEIDSNAPKSATPASHQP